MACPAFRLTTGEDIRKYVRLNILEGGILQYDIMYPDTKNGSRGVRVLMNPSMQSWTYRYEDDYRVIFDENGGAHTEAGKEIHLEACSVIAAELI